MLEDALLDLTNRGDLIIDPFLGSGSTVIAAEATGRVCRGVELNSLYVDVIIRRYEAATGDLAVLVETGETFQALSNFHLANQQIGFLRLSACADSRGAWHGGKVFGCGER